VAQSLSGSYSLVRVHLEHELHQIYFDIVHNRCVSDFEHLRLEDFWELEPLVTNVPLKLFLKEVGKRTQHFLDYEKLVDLGFSREERLSVHELAHDAPNCPNVDFFSIRHVVADEQEFWRAIPSSGDIVCEFRADIPVVVFFSV